MSPVPSKNYIFTLNSDWDSYDTIIAIYFHSTVENGKPERTRQRGSKKNKNLQLMMRGYSFI